MIFYMEKKECRVYFLLFPVASFPLKSSESHVKLRTKFKRTLYDKMTELLFKVIIVGDATVGKTSFVRRYVSNHPGREYKPTQGGRALQRCFCLYISMTVYKCEMNIARSKKDRKHYLMKV